MPKSYRDQFLTEFDLETKFIREHIVRVPDDKLQWKPHVKSMPIGWLATFLGMIWQWAEEIVTLDSFDPIAAQVAGKPPSVPSTTREIVEIFDRQTAAARAVLADASDESFDAPWTLLANGTPVFTQPRWILLRTYVMNHAIHHRAQLGVYLRLLGVPVPAVYSDSAE